MLAQLIMLANQNSHSDNPEGLGQVADSLEECFRPLGIPCIRKELQPRQWIDDFGENQRRDSNPALIWNLRSQLENKILLAIHYDTVYPKDSPFQKCQWLDGKRLHGPGVADAKGGIICLLWGLLAAERFGLLPKLGWSVVLNPDEEIGSPCSWPLWRELAPQYRYGLLFEPSLPDGSLVNIRKGSGMFTVVMRGRAAHAGRHFEQGRNAIVALSEMVGELHRWNGQLPGTTINVGRFVGGQAVNAVPDLAIARINVRISDFQQQETFESRLSELVKTYNTREGFQCRCEGGFHAPPKVVCPQTERLMASISQAAAQQSREVRFVATGGVSDGNKLAAAGLPNIDTLGPAGDRLHSSEEWVDTESLFANAERLLRLLVLLQAD